MTFTLTEIELLAEALAARAARLESYGRFRPQGAGPNDRKAAAMRQLRQKLLDMKSREIADADWLRKFCRQNIDQLVDVKGG